jgi:hypothetical protein
MNEQFFFPWQIEVYDLAARCAEVYVVGKTIKTRSSTDTRTSNLSFTDLFLLISSTIYPYHWGLLVDL